MRAAVLQAIMDKLNDLGTLKHVYGKQRDWRTESEFPFACVFFPAQSFDQKHVTGNVLSSFKSSGLVTIRVVVINSDDTPELELDELLDSILSMLVADSRLNNTVKTSDILQVQTDGGIIISHSIGDINLQVQI